MNLSAMKRQSVPLHVEVAAMIRNQIMSGELGHGSQLPPLRELTETLGVARMTVKQAMDALVEEGLIERYSGRGTFVKDVDLPERQTLNMKAKLSQLQAMVEQLEVSVLEGGSAGDKSAGQIVTEAGVDYQSMKRIHARDSQPFCRVDLLLEHGIYQQAPQRFDKEIVVSVLKDLGITVESARQRVTISYADLETASALEVSLNSPVFRVFREFFGADGQLIYSANLIYPGDMLELDIEFTVEI